MVTFACTLNYLLFLEIALRTTLSRGKIRPSRISLFLVGDKSETAYMEKWVHGRFARIHITKVGDDHPDFAFMKNSMERGLCKAVDYMDYFRAWIGNHHSKYLWLDVDIVVNGDLRPLVERVEASEKLLMAPDLPLQPSKNADAYFKIYKKAFGDLPATAFDSRGMPVKYNSGVLGIDRNYESLWRKLFAKVKNERAPYVGQGIWNLIYWSTEGEPLERTYNDLRDHKSQSSIVRHYISLHKPEMLAKALKMGIV